MRNINTWLKLYGLSHKNPINKNIHKICVPLIMISILGLLTLIPSPTFFKDLGLDYAKAFILLIIMYYFLLSRIYCFLMIVIIIPMLLVITYLNNNCSTNFNLTLWLSIFIFSWIGQFIGHKIEGKKPSFLEDLSFLLIGPLWIIAPIIRSIHK